MKILHLSSEITWRGGEQQIAWLIKELDHLSHKSHVFCPNKSMLADHCRENNIAHTLFDKRFGISIRAAQAFVRTVRSVQPDIIHIHDSNSQTTTLLAWIIFRIRIPLVLSRRVDFPIAKNKISSWKYNHDSIKRIICVSQAVKQIVAPKIRDKKKIVIVPDGIDLTRFPEFPNGELRSIVKVSLRAPLIGNIAALADHKDHITFVRTAAIIAKKIPEAHFVIIGEDLGERLNLQKLVDDLELSDRIHFLGFRNDIELLIGDLDVFLFTSKTEGLGTAIMDAMAAGIPIVATNAGGIGEIIEHNHNGWLSKVGSSKELAEGVMNIVEHPGIATLWVKEAKKVVNKFSIERMARSTVEVYNSVLRNNRLGGKKPSTSHYNVKL